LVGILYENKTVYFIVEKAREAKENQATYESEHYRIGTVYIKYYI